jgi:hypothetical protein
VSHFQKKLEGAVREWEATQQSYKKENQGIVIVVFKNQDCVQETIDELEIVKSRLVGKPHFDKINIQEWQICPAITANDIVWPNIGRMMESSTLVNMLSFIGSFLLSTAVVFSLLTLESLLLHFFP